MSIRKPSIWGYDTAPNNIVSRYDWNVERLGPFRTWVVNKPKFIPTPDWVERIEGYSAEAFDISNDPSYDKEKIVVVCFKPNRTLGVGFAKVYVADKGMKNAFPQMRGIWGETKSRMPFAEHALDHHDISRCQIDDDGRISSSFGIPDMPSLMDVVQEMYTVWLDWREFPNVGEYQMVKKLIQAKQDVAKMQSEMSTNRINGKIEDIRQEIQESQLKIAELEKELNVICERAADAMNLLEENGVKVDLDEKQKEEEEGKNDWIVGMDHSGISHARPSQGVIIDCGNMTTTLSPDLFQLSKEELDAIQTAWGDYSSCLTVDDSVSPFTTTSGASCTSASSAS